jgi:hypothetical protein
MLDWQPIEIYSKDYLEREEINWGPPVLPMFPLWLRFPGLMGCSSRILKRTNG